MKRILFVLCLLFSFTSNAQSIEGTELGLEGTFGASNLGGSFGIGVKYGWKFGEYFIAGPSVRYQRTWFQAGLNTASPTSGGFNIFGGGGFIHARFFNALFVGVESEILRTPLNGNFSFSSESNWSPNFFIGGGYSMEFNETWRLNLGILYDVIDSDNSPLQFQYTTRNSQGVLLPIIYRINFFFPIGGE
ncbi:MAG: hypothetical protein DCO96_09735 [Fluviicola sp. XM-24bin1]|nr:MAG: hypothetical protein DCO96_09735 [Fluviicola sp. XM-24bin1]